MSISLTVEDFQKFQDELNQAFDEFASDASVTVGIHEEAGNVESDDLTMAALGAVHEFGATINHPGGTSYGYATKAAADRDQVRFLKSGAGYMELGKTGPHIIEIPARPWLVPGVTNATEKLTQTVQDGLEDGLSLEQISEQLGAVAAGEVKKYMTELSSPPNAPSTRRQKGSSNPLIDSGAMRASVNYKVGKVDQSEGLE